MGLSDPFYLKIFLGFQVRDLLFTLNYLLLTCELT